jgi:endonuclease/exonuclease/phosphatase family metal-dependent hydrolase
MKQSKTAGIILSLINLTIFGGCSASKRVAQQEVFFAPQQSNEIKLMTFNIRVDTVVDGFRRWGRRQAAVINMIAHHGSDIVGLQEALDHQVRDVSRALPQYAFYAVGRNDGARDGETCAIFYRRDRFALQDSGTFWFTDTPDRPGRDWGALWPRICSWVRLRQKDTGQSFYVYNVHMDPLSQQSRRKSVRLLAQRIAHRKTNDPFIVMGDFNMKLSNSAMEYLHEVGHYNPRVAMVDAWRSLNPRGNGIGTKIDHIPLSSGFQALRVEVDKRKVNGRRPSDHYPVIASVRIKKPALMKAENTKKTNQAATAANTRQAGGTL